MATSLLLTWQRLLLESLLLLLELLLPLLELLPTFKGFFQSGMKVPLPGVGETVKALS